ncbi:S1/P1 nuclease [Photobacterium sp. SDRW27]|uniref:S1/P1 nuclease n=1 Tax=Photobacterium obscurum TaxID=2829490 RepID=UPI002244CD44|nr:S1/P1 nuclease [Photobacterium obscurum]MCW8331228.1 S1/P1 nuclease [Photobacterium obscurum]
MNKKNLIASVVAALALVPSVANAWNYQGHVTVAEIAYQNLNITARSEVDALAQKAYLSMPADIQKKMDSFEGASQFAKLAMVPDLIRKVPAQDVWQSMGEEIPASLNQWDEKTTGAWHYINQAYPASSACNFVHVPNIKLVANRLFEDFKQNPQAASMMFMSHVAGDSHQPMHSISQSLSADKCVTDLGANKHTLNIPQKDLHHLWDSGMGFLDTPYNVHDVAAQLQQAYPKASMELGETADINQWLKESYQLADFGYSVEKDTTPSEEHFRQGTQYVKQRMSQAGYRLADEINHVFPAK